jgi:FKBP-type peptidyl-prolyl cis-trans isomerase FklB
MNRKALATAATFGIFFIATGCTAQEQRTDTAQGPKTEITDLTDKVSYSIGLSIGRDFKEQGIEINPDVLARGLRDGLTGQEPALTEEQMRETQMEFQQVMIAKMEALQKELAEKNLQEGQAFLSEHAQQEGVVVLPSGLQYRVIEEGTGKSPTADSMVTVHYRGRLVDGTEFDSSYDRGEPATFPVSGVISGWTEGLQLMKEGGKHELVIPPALAYGEQGAGPVIGPNAVLVFEVELIKVQ